MHNAYTQARQDLAYYVHSPRRVLVRRVVHDTRSTYPRRDYNRFQTYSRDRNRRT